MPVLHARDHRDDRPNCAWPSVVWHAQLTRILVVVAIQLCLLAIARPATAAQQVIRLSAGWNLVSLTVPPANPAVQTVLAPLISEDSLQAMWTFNSNSGTWSVFKVRGEDL